MPGAGILAGKKTYVVCVVGIIGAVGAYLTGDLAPADAINTAWQAIAVAFLRAGVAKVGQ